MKLRSESIFFCLYYYNNNYILITFKTKYISLKLLHFPY